MYWNEQHRAFFGKYRVGGRWPMPTVQVFRQVQFTGTDGKPVSKPPKRQSHRIVPLHPGAADALRWSHDPVFPSASGDYSSSRAADLFRPDLKAAGLPTVFDGKHPFTFHACRRTFMSLLEAEGVPRELIGALAGHAGKGVAHRHYIAKNIGRFDEAIRSLKLPASETLAWIG